MRSMRKPLGNRGGGLKLPFERPLTAARMKVRE